MASQEPTIKKANLLRITGYLALQALLFFTVNNITSLGSTPAATWEILTKSGPWAVGLPLVALVLSYMMPTDLKLKLVFLRRFNPLPGCRVFSELAPHDPRINLKAVKLKLGPLPTDPKEQNRVWYGVYKQIQDEPVVFQAHKSYLLFRELAAISAMLVPVLGIPTFVLSGFKVGAFYLLALVVVLACVTLAGKNAGERFTCTVLARTDWT